MGDCNMSNVIELVQEEKEVKEVMTVFKNTQPIGDIIVRAREIQKGCRDFVVPSNGVSFGVKNSAVPMMQFAKHDLREGNTVMNALDIGDHAFSQMCSKIGVPVRFMKKCMKDQHPELVADSIDTYLKEQKDKTMFVRANGDRVRGILSEKYSVLDAPDILESIQEVIPTAKVKSFFLTDERLHMRIIGDMLDIPEEDLFWGLQVDSSDVGRSTLKVQFMIYKQICTNGMCVSKGDASIFTQKHIGITKQEFITDFRQGLSAIPDLVAMSIKAITDSKNQMPKKEVNNLLAKALETLKVDKKSKLDEKMMQLIPKYGQSRWGVINALTEISQEFTLERRLEFEALAGKMLIA
jgi:urease gamma subunit